MPLPTEANFEVRNIIECCWEYSPDLRPQFSELLKFFSENPAEYSNLKELLTNQDLGQLGRWEFDTKENLISTTMSQIDWIWVQIQKFVFEGSFIYTVFAFWVFFAA